MAIYALQVAYTSLAWAALVKTPENRLEAVRPVVERLGGSIMNGWFSFGEYDVLVICDMPDASSAAALSMAIAASGAVKTSKTTPLMTFDEGMVALRNARDAGYAAPATEIPYFDAYRTTV